MNNRLLVFSAALSAGLVYIFSVYRIGIELSHTVYNGIVAGTAGSPDRYRVLLHYTMDLLVPAAKDDVLVFVSASGVTGFLLTIGFVVLFHIWMNALLPQTQALLGTMLMTAMLMTMFHAVWAIFDTPQLIEAVAVLWALLLIYRQPARWRWWILIVIVLASLNRATGGMVALIFVVAQFDKARREWYWIAVYGAISVAIFFGLRLMLGIGDPLTEPWSATVRFLTHNPTDAIMWNLPLLPLFFIAYRNYRQLPQLLQRVLWLVPIYTLALLYRASINEIGLWLTVMPFIIPAALWHLSINDSITKSQ